MRAGVWRKAELDPQLHAAGARQSPASPVPASRSSTCSTSSEDSVLCVTSVKGKFVKFRLTGWRDGSDSAALKFVETWSSALAEGRD